MNKVSILLAEIRGKYPEIKINSQPSIARLELIKLEKEHGITTEYMLENKVDIDKSTIDEWISLYQTYLTFKGELNTTKIDCKHGGFIQ